MAFEERAKRRFRVAYAKAERWHKALEAAVRTGNPELRVESAHLTAHNAVVAFRNLRLGRSGKLEHEEVAQAALEAGMPPPLAAGAGQAEAFHIPVAYGGRSLSESEVEVAVAAARRVFAFVRATARKRGLIG